jgi:hypothetical protein
VARGGGEGGGWWDAVPGDGGEKNGSGPGTRTACVCGAGEGAGDIIEKVREFSVGSNKLRYFLKKKKKLGLFIS